MKANPHSCENHFLAQDESLSRNANKAKLVLILTLVTMVVEIYFGYVTGSMALLADGWHMTTHAAALGITALTYRLAQHPGMVKNFNFGGGKIIALGGFASSVLLLFVVAVVGFDSVMRFFKPQEIHFDEALWVAIIGLVVNLISAFILRDDHSHAHGAGHSHEDEHSHDHADHDHIHNHSQNHSHDHDHSHDHGHSGGHQHDLNIRGAYLHVVADALTSVGAIIALIAGKYYGWTMLDPLIGLVGMLVILKWSIGLIKDTGWELLDGHALSVNFEALRKRIEGTGGRIVDLHVWKIAPKMLACELVVTAPTPRGLDHYRRILHTEFGIQHSVIEERV